MGVFLRGLKKDDYETIYSYRETIEVNSLTSGNSYFTSIEYVKKWVEDVIFSKTDIYLAICDTSTKEMLGFLSINDIDYRNRKAQWGGILIGDKNNWGKGIAKEASSQMLRFVFDELNINCFWAFWLVDNVSSIKLGEKLGFSKVGVLQQSIYKGGKYHDQLIMAIMKIDYDRIRAS